MFRHILVPLDGSSCAEQALPIAARLAHASGGTLMLLRIVPRYIDWGLQPLIVSQHSELTGKSDEVIAQEYLRKVASSDTLRGITVHIDVMTGPVAQTILLFAKIQPADLIIIYSHGITEHKHWPFRSVGLHVAYHSPVPVFVLHEGNSRSLLPSQETTRPLRVLIPLDGSSLAETVLIAAAQLCLSLHGSLHLVRVLRLPEERDPQETEHRAHMRKLIISRAEAYLHEVSQDLRKGDFTKLTITSSVVVHPDIASTLIQEAKHGEPLSDYRGSDTYNVIAMAVHGHNGPLQWATGSISHLILESVCQPMLLVQITPSRKQKQQDDFLRV
jgi:nucleotide-binding universal stress UspA family protein